jgi:maltose/moltooligosaccharide transporter
MTVKPRLGFWQIWNMSFGFLGIQFGWGLQMANMSAIYEYLGASAAQIPILWLAAPLTGLIVQPVIGHMSDRTWNRLGRRRPYFLSGALLSSAALVLMPQSSALWMAAGLLWILDASINVSMEPFRAFVADMLPEEQRTQGFAMQSIFIGLGAIVASALPYMLTNWFGVSPVRAPGSIPASVRLSFYLGAAAFFGAVLWTILTTREYPPPDMEAFRRMKAQRSGPGENVREIFRSIAGMPPTMRQLALVQFFTWLGLFCMWLYFAPAVARNVFGAANEMSPAYSRGAEWAGVCFSTYSAVCFVFSWALPGIASKLGRRGTHALCLLSGAAGLLSVAVIHNQYLLLVSMVGVGMAWASTVSMPYAMLAGAIPPEKTGIYMGIFNFAIVLPEILASLGFGWVMIHILNNNRLHAVVAGGICLIVAASLLSRVRGASAVTSPGPAVAASGG